MTDWAALTCHFYRVGAGCLRAGFNEAHHLPILALTLGTLILVPTAPLALSASLRGDATFSTQTGLQHSDLIPQGCYCVVDVQDEIFVATEASGVSFNRHIVGLLFVSKR